MTKREKIRERLKTVILMNVETNRFGDVVFKIDGLSNVFSCLRSEGLMIKVERELPKPKDPKYLLWAEDEIVEAGFVVGGIIVE